MRTKVDRAGRVVIPLPLRRLLGLVDGGEVDLEPTGDGLLIRRVEGSASVSTGEDGLPVIEVGGVGTVTNDDVLEAIRADRVSR